MFATSLVSARFTCSHASCTASSASLSEPSLAIATINAWNRLDAATRQVAGEWIKAAQQAAH
jgi:hypothetical protein